MKTASRLRALITSGIAAASLLLAGMTATATATDAAYQPDGRVSLPCHQELPDCRTQWFGDDIYNTAASRQTAKYVDYPNFYDVVAVTFKIKIQNDGTTHDRYRVGATGTTAGFQVRFFAGTTDVTAEIKAGTFTTPWVSPGDTYFIRAKVKPLAPRDGDKTTRLITIASRNNPTKQDAVKIVRNYVEARLRLLETSSSGDGTGLNGQTAHIAMVRCG